MRSIHILLGVAVSLTALAPGCTDAPADPPSGIPPEVVEFANDWPLPGRDYLNTRSTTHSPIDSSNVSRLGIAWETTLSGRGGAGNAATTPLIAGDTVYMEDLSSNIRAFDLASGAIRWERRYDAFSIGPNGVALGWGKIFAIQGSTSVVALDSATGAEVWTRRVVRGESDGIDIQPTVYGDKVLVSTVPVSLGGIYKGGDRGILQALDEESGDLIWEFDTVDSPDLWGNPEVNSGGGAWFPPSIDVDSGRVYWGIANPAPFPGVPDYPNGVSRPGPNLYTDSTLVLDVSTGELDWYHQAVQHDLFDRDFTHTLLVDVGAGSGRERIAVGTGKLGRVLGYDPTTGALLWDTTVGVHLNDDLEALPPGETVVFPGSYGGVLTPPASAGGLVYVATLNAPSTYVPDQTNYFGSDLGTMPGQLVAIDARTGAIVWDVPVDGDPLGGATVVNDLVFTATFQGSIFAFDRLTGTEVWRLAAPGGINGWPAVAGDTIVWPVGLASPARLIALRLDAGAPQPASDS